MSDVGQITIVRSTGFWPFIIRAVTASHWSHNTIIISDTECVSAEGSGVKIMKRSDFPDSVTSDFILTDREQLAIKAFALGQVGKRYGYLTDFWIGIALITKAKTPRWIERILSNKSTWECAQLCDAAYTYAGIHLFRDDRPTGAVYPGSLAKIFVSYGWTDKP